MKFTLRFSVAIASAVWLAAAQADAALIQFVVPLSGANEVPSGSGDPDGSGTANLTIDSVALTISWNITVFNLDTVILDHIHAAPAGMNGPVVVDFGGQLTGSGLSDPDLAAVLANPAGHYVNVHTNTFQGGAIRGQLAPEPGTSLLIGTGLLLLAVSARRRSR
jgi:hypothetical protein